MRLGLVAALVKGIDFAKCQFLGLRSYVREALSACSVSTSLPSRGCSHPAPGNDSRCLGCCSYHRKSLVVRRSPNNGRSVPEVFNTGVDSMGPDSKAACRYEDSDLNPPS